MRGDVRLMGIMVEGSGDGLGLCLHDGLPSMAQLLQPAQDKLRQQLLATKQRLEEELRERCYAIKVRLDRRLATLSGPQTDNRCCGSGITCIYRSAAGGGRAQTQLWSGAIWLPTAVGTSPGWS